MNDFFNAQRVEITMIRGDSMAFNFQLQGLAGLNPYDIKFTCKEHYDDELFYFQQSLSEGGITIIDYDAQTDTTTFCCRVRPDQTENLDLARYYYDLRLEATDVITLLTGRLTLVHDVTRG